MQTQSQFQTRLPNGLRACPRGLGPLTGRAALYRYLESNFAQCISRVETRGSVWLRVPTAGVVRLTTDRGRSAKVAKGSDGDYHEAPPERPYYWRERFAEWANENFERILTRLEADPGICARGTHGGGFIDDGGPCSGIGGYGGFATHNTVLAGKLTNGLARVPEDVRWAELCDLLDHNFEQALVTRSIVGRGGFTTTYPFPWILRVEHDRKVDTGGGEESSSSSSSPSESQSSSSGSSSQSSSPSSSESESGSGSPSDSSSSSSPSSSESGSPSTSDSSSMSDSPSSGGSVSVDPGSDSSSSSSSSSSPDDDAPCLADLSDQGGVPYLYYGTPQQVALPTTLTVNVYEDIYGASDCSGSPGTTPGYGQPFTATWHGGSKTWIWNGAGEMPPENSVTVGLITAPASHPTGIAAGTCVWYVSSDLFSSGEHSIKATGNSPVGDYTTGCAAGIVDRGTVS